MAHLEDPKMVECLLERLYLDKEGKGNKIDVYVEKCPYVQHQLDGIRFLYRAFKKKKSGVILNDPSGYGKRVQTVLFLSAILPTLDKPVLILCKEGTETLWLDHFLKWTQVSNDVSVELTNPFIKKKVLVTPSYNAAAFARREWSHLVVDNGLSKDLLKAPLRAELRIWITSVNVKEDLSLYSTFHSWITPKDKFCAEKFKAKVNDIRDVIAKTIMLDAFLEDTVLRRTGFNTPFLSPQVPIQVEKPRVTKKNKDATGMKIKRTKRKSVDTDNAVIEIKLKKGPRVIEENTEVFKTSVNDNNDEDFTQLIFKNNKKPKLIWNSDSEDDNVTKLQEINKIKTNETQSQQTLYYESDSDSDSHRNTALNKSNKLNNTHSKKTNSYHTDITDDKKNNVEDLEDNSIIVIDEMPNNEVKTVIQISPVANEIKSDLSNELDTLKEDHISPVNNNEILNLESQNSSKDEIHKIPNEVKNDIKFSQDLFSTDFSYKNTVEGIKNTNVVEVKNETANENDKTERTKPVTTTLSSYELKLKQLEELTMKKFKGTFFDRIL